MLTVATSPIHSSTLPVCPQAPKTSGRAGTSASSGSIPEEQRTRDSPPWTDSAAHPPKPPPGPSKNVSRTQDSTIFTHSMHLQVTIPRDCSTCGSHFPRARDATIFSTPQRCVSVTHRSQVPPIRRRPWTASHGRDSQQGSAVAPYEPPRNSNAKALTYTDKRTGQLREAVLKTRRSPMNRPSFAHGPLRITRGD